MKGYEGGGREGEFNINTFPLMVERHSFGMALTNLWSFIYRGGDCRPSLILLRVSVSQLVILFFSLSAVYISNLNPTRHKY